jgi:hypothetical protein
MDSISNLAQTQTKTHVDSIQTMQTEFEQSIVERQKEKEFYKDSIAEIGIQVNATVDKGVVASKSALEKVESKFVENCDSASAVFGKVDQQSRYLRDEMSAGLDKIATFAVETNTSIDGFVSQMKETREEAGHLIDGVLEAEMESFQQIVQNAEMKCDEQRGMLNVYEDSARLARNEFQFVLNGN